MDTEAVFLWLLEMPVMRPEVATTMPTDNDSELSGEEDGMSIQKKKAIVIQQSWKGKASLHILLQEGATLERNLDLSIKQHF